MNYSILEINDIGINLWKNKNLLYSSPGYALLNKKLIFGEQARKQAQIQPQNINNIFWSKLDTEMLNTAFGEIRHNADIAHKHLIHISKQIGGGDIVIIVPIHYSKTQLSLLLGIITESQFHVVGMVEGCLAKMLPQLHDEPSIYLDIQLHHICIAQIELRKGFWQCIKSFTLSDLGWLTLKEKMCQVIADIFVKQTRFDPLKDALTEQILHNRLKEYLETIQNNGSVKIECRNYSIRIEADVFTSECEIFYKTLLKTLPEINSTIYCSSLLTLLPGFQSAFPQAIKTNENNIIETIAENELTIIKKNKNILLTRGLPPSPGIHRPKGKKEKPPTHILYANRAYPLLSNVNWLNVVKPDLRISGFRTNDSEIAVIFNQQELRLKEPQNCSIMINGVAADVRAKLSIGDSMEWNGNNIIFIAMQREYGP
tara:strand:- start:813 stop:2096 length:1284 start_codon:yes stop_codon:yes gene_type:complete